MNQFGFYRARVVNNKDPAKQGRVLVNVPVIMPELEKDEGIWARPGNNPYGGRNMEDNHHYGGTWIVPSNGSWILVFFEGGNTDQPFYLGSLEIGHPPNAPTAPAECREGNYEKKWLIFKSPEGRGIVVSDDPSDCRIEITGKKLKISNPPHGDVQSVYEIDGNQNVILLDEMEGREKLLIRTRLGDFIHVDIGEQRLQCSFANDIILQSRAGNIHLQGKDIHVKATGNINYESTGGTINRKAKLNIHDETGAEHHIKAAGPVIRAGTSITDHSSGANSAEGSNPIIPDGERDT